MGSVRHARWEAGVRGEVIVESVADLLQVVDALSSTGRLSGGLDRRQEQRDENADDRDDYEELDERESTGRIGWL